MKGKPIQGWPSRTAAVAALMGEGLGTRDIADRLGMDTKTVAALQPRERGCSGHRHGARRAAPLAPGQLSPLADALCDRMREADAVQGSAALLRAIRAYQRRAGDAAGAR